MATCNHYSSFTLFSHFKRNLIAKAEMDRQLEFLEHVG